MCVLALGAALAPTATAGVQTAIGALTVASTTAVAYSAYAQSRGAREQASYQKAVNANNAVMSEYAAADAEKRGEEAVKDQARQITSFRSNQQAVLASRGLDITTGSPLDILESSAYYGGVDQARTRENAQREAWGYRVEGQNYTGASAMYGAQRDANSPLLATTTSLLNSGANVAQSWIRRT